MTLLGQSFVAVICACALTLVPSVTSHRLGHFTIVAPTRIYHAGVSNLFQETNRGLSVHFLPTLPYSYNIPYMGSAFGHPALYNPTAVNPVPPRHHQTAARFQATPTARTEDDVEGELPVIGFQSSQWVWPNAEVTGPLGGLPSVKNEDARD